MGSTVQILISMAVYMCAVILIGIWNIYELLPAFLLSCIFIVVVSLLTAPPSADTQEEFDAVAGKAKN